MKQRKLVFGIVVAVAVVFIAALVLLLRAPANTRPAASPIVASASPSPRASVGPAENPRVSPKPVPSAPEGPDANPSAATVAADDVTTTSARVAPTATPTTAASAGPTPMIAEVMAASDTPQPRRVVISGTVTDPDRKALAGATVAIYSAPGMRRSTGIALVSAITDESGAYRLESDDNARLLLRASKEGYGASGKTIETPDFSRIAERVRNLRQDFRLEPEAILAGIVVDEGGQPVANANVAAMRENADAGSPFRTNDAECFPATSASDGRFEIKGVSPGSWVGYAWAGNYAYARATTQIPGGDLRLVLRGKTGEISGTVFYKESGEPVAGAQVVASLAQSNANLVESFAASSSTVAATTDASGAYKLQGVAAGEYRVEASKPPLRFYQPGSASVKVDAGAKIFGHDLFLYGGYHLTGRVLEKDTDKPIEGVRLVVINSGWNPGTSPIEDTTDSAGKFELSPILAENAVSLQITREGYRLPPGAIAADFFPVRLEKENLNPTVDIHMVPAVRISGIVRRADGQEVTKGTVGLYEQGPGIPSAPIAEGGRFQFDTFPMSRVTVAARVPGFAVTRSNTINVLNEPVDGIEIVLEKPGAISGVVLGSQGTRVGAAKVSATFELVAPNGDLISPVVVETDAQGAFTMNNIPPREISIQASAAGYSPSATVPVALKPGESKRGIELRLGASHFLAGMVVNDDQVPIEKAELVVNVGEWSQSVRTITDAAGRFRLDGLPDGSVDVSVSGENASKWFQNQTVDRADVVYVLEPRDRKETTLIATIINEATRKPIPEARLEMMSMNQWNVKVANEPGQPGTFRVEHLMEGGTYTFNATAAGFAPSLSRILMEQTEDHLVRKRIELKLAVPIIGRVVNAEGTPLPDVQAVQSTRGSFGYTTQRFAVDSTTTDSEGRFRFEAARSGENAVRFVPKAPYAERIEILTPTDTNVYDMGDIALDGGATLRVLVAREPGSQPLAGKQVILSRDNNTEAPAERAAMTDGSGIATFAALSNEACTVTLPDYRLAVVVPALSKAEETVTIPVGSATLKGRVMAGPKPVSEARISLGLGPVRVSNSLKSDPDGRFECPNLAPGSWSIQISTRESSRHLNRTIEIPSTGSVDQVFQMGGGNIVGRVEDAQGALVEGAKVWWTGPKGGNPMYGDSTESGSDGSFATPPLMTGGYELNAELAGKGRAGIDPIAVPEMGSTAPIVLRLDGGGGGTLVSAVYHYDTGEPVREAWCSIKSKDTNAFLRHHASRKSDGIMIVPDIPPGDYVVNVSAPNLSSAVHNITITRGGTERVEDVLYAAGSMWWKLTDAEGKPVAGAPITLKPANPESIEAPRSDKSSSGGIFSQRGLAVGEYRGEALVNGVPVVEMFLIRAGETVRKETKVP